MRVAVIVNPLAGGRQPGRFSRHAVETLVARVAACAGVSAQVHVTVGPGGGHGGARAALDHGADLLVAWGGDGTVNEVASVLAGTGVPLGIVPAGSGNGLARELGLPRAPAAALRTAFARRTRLIDVGLLDGRIFVNAAGFGFDAQVARRFNASGAARGLARYIRLTIAEMLTYTSDRYHVRWSGGAFQGDALLVGFANSRQYGNGARLAPDAVLDDGAVDLVIVRPTTPFRDLLRARKLFTGTILADGLVEHARVRAATIAGAHPIGCHLDGEPQAERERWDVSVRPAALHVCGA